jgi:YggT family protein
VTALCWLLQAAWIALFARIILEWIPVSYDHPVARLRGVLRIVTEPVLAPVRRLIPPVRTGAIALDLTPLIVLILVSIVTTRVC